MEKQKNKNLDDNNKLDPALGVTGLFSFITYLIWLYLSKKKDKKIKDVK